MMVAAGRRRSRTAVAAGVPAGVAEVRRIPLGQQLAESERRTLEALTERDLFYRKLAAISARLDELELGDDGQRFRTCNALADDLTKFLAEHDL